MFYKNKNLSVIMQENNVFRNNIFDVCMLIWNIQALKK
jgi:hypothetical protein